MPCQNCSCPSCLAIFSSHIPSGEFPQPPSDLVAANRAPTDSEVAYSRDIINSLEKTVSLIQTMVDDLEKRKGELLGLITTHRAAISLLRSFPPELLAEMFTQFVTMAESHWCPGSRPPLMLMGICSRWRRIVLDTPRLWTKIFTHPPTIEPWVLRSKDLPLHLELNLSWSTSYPVLEALIPHSHRWEHVDFRLEPSSSSVLARVRARLRSLKRLNLSLYYITGTVDFCEVAPQLTEVKLTEIYEPVIIKLPWEQLRICTLDNSGVALYILQHAENLRTLRLDMSKMLDDPWLLMPRSPHSRHLGLDTLVMHWSPMDPDLSLFFSSITLPSLRILEVRFGYPGRDYSSDDGGIDDQSELAPIISGFFERSSTHLSKLNLIDIPFSPRGLIKCLSFVPSLVALDICFNGQWHGIDDEILRRLNVNHPQYILPRIRSLSLRGPGAFSEELLDALVTSRRDISPTNDQVSLLENLTLDCSTPQSNSTSRLPRFQRFASEGLNITYGEDWHIYNSIQAANPKPLAQEQAEIAASLGRTYFSGKVELSDPS